MILLIIILKWYDFNEISAHLAKRQSNDLFNNLYYLFELRWNLKT